MPCSAKQNRHSATNVSRIISVIYQNGLVGMRSYRRRLDYTFTNDTRN